MSIFLPVLGTLGGALIGGLVVAPGLFNLLSSPRVGTFNGLGVIPYMMVGFVLGGVTGTSIVLASVK